MNIMVSRKHSDKVNIVPQYIGIKNTPYNTLVQLDDSEWFAILEGETIVYLSTLSHTVIPCNTTQSWLKSSKHKGVESKAVMTLTQTELDA